MWRLLPKPLLAGSVPDLQFDRLPADVDHPGAELHANGVVGVLFDCVLVREREMRVVEKEIVQGLFQVQTVLLVMQTGL